MGIEVERKFLVSDPAVVAGHPGLAYRQGYLSVDPKRVVRVRVAGDRAYLTIKGPSDGPSRLEFEYGIPVSDADALLGLCLRPLVEKLRYRIEHEGLVWEVDVFAGENEGLVVAEVEIAAPDAPVALPSWAGPEVTADPRYANANLVEHPWRTWGRQPPEPATREPATREPGTIEPGTKDQQADPQGAS